MTNLNPKTAKKIRAFGRRRRLLILIRGLCSLLTLGICSLVLVAVLDYLFFMEDWMRYVLTAIAYVASAVILYITSLRYLSHKSNMRELARLFEAASPELREDLLSAVELGESDGNGLDSDEFRRLLQDDVAERIDKLKVESILPSKLILRWLQAAVVVAVVFGALLAIPQLRFGKLMLRAAAPMANVERVSDVSIKILEPASPNTVVPIGDSIPLVVEVSDPDVERAWLELIPEGGKRIKMPLDPLAKKRFSGSISIGRQNLEYRVRADTGLTRFYMLTVQSRPRVVQFRKTVTYPEYTRSAPKTVTEENGSIKVIEGSTVDLAIKPDQKLKAAELRIDMPDGKKTIPLEAQSDGWLQAAIPVQQSGSFRVHLVAAKTGFDNKFSPQYEIRAQADIVPSITLLKPENDLSAPANELIGVKGRAKDDLGLVAVHLQYRVNDGRWKRQRVAIEDGARRADFIHRFDLNKVEGLRPGDEVLFRLAATDLKGSNGNSATRRVTISAVGFDPQRLTVLQYWQRVQKTLGRLAEGSMAFDRATGEVLREFSQAQDDVTREQLILKMVTEAKRGTELAAKSGEVVKKVVPLLDDRQAISDAVLVGRVVSRVHLQFYRPVMDTVSSAQKEDADYQKHMLDQARTEITKGSHIGQKAAPLFDKIVDDYLVARIGADLRKLRIEQEQVVAMGGQDMLVDDAGERIKRRQQIIRKNLNEIVALCERMNEGDAKNIMRKIEQVDEKIVKTLEDGPREQFGSFQGQYFAGKDFNNLKHERDDKTINFVWNGSPAPGVPAEGFSVRWTGTFIAQKDGLHYFHTSCDDGSRLWIGQKKLIDDWTQHAEQERIGKIKLEKGKAYPVRMEFFDIFRTGIARLYWSEDGKRKQLLRSAEGARYDLRSVAHDLLNIHRAAENFRERTRREAGKAREKLREMAGKPAEALAKAREELENALKDKADEAKAERAKEQLEAAADELKKRAELEETRSDQDPDFVKDTAKVAEALESLANDELTDDQAEELNKLTDAYETLEAAHELKEATAKLDEIASSERWDKADAERAEKTAEAWNEYEDRLDHLTDNLSSNTDEQKEFKKKLQELERSREARAVGNEMNQREKHERVNRDVSEPVDQLRNELSEADSMLDKQLEEARKAVDDAAPKLSDKLADIQQLAKETSEATRKEAEAAPDKSAEEVQKEAAALKAKQEALNDKLEDVKDALRRDANAQDLATEEGRERARDADDALAMLHQPPPKAEELLGDAAASDDKQEQQSKLNQANEMQEKIVDAMEKVKDHYKNLEQGTPEDTREQLRQQEKEMGIAEQMDQRYNEAAAMAGMEDLDKAIEALEQKLENNQEMQEELNHISAQAQQKAAESMGAAAKREQSLSKRMDKEAEKQTKRQSALAKAMDQAANDLNELHRKTMPKLQKQARNSSAKDEIRKADEAVANAAKSMPKSDQSMSPEAQEQSRSAVNQLLEAAKALDKAAKESQKNRELSNDSRKAQQDASKLAGQVNRLAQEMSNIQKGMSREMSNAGRQQEAASQEASAAQANLERAARHQQRLGENQKAGQVEAAAQQVQSVRDQEMGSAQASINQDQASAQSAQQPVKQAAQAAQQAAESLNTMAQNAQSTPSSTPPTASQWLARALDQMDSAQSGSPEQNSAALQQAKAALQQAMQAQAQAMAQSRSEMPSMGQPSDESQGPENAQTFDEAIAKNKNIEDIDWTNLPKRVAREIRSNDVERVPEQYSGMVGSYFKVIAERSQKEDAE